MFVGHLAVALAAKPVRRTSSLGWFFAATTTPDLLWPLFLSTGLEHVRIEPGATAFTPLVFESYPWSHSLLMCAVWASERALAWFALIGRIVVPWAVWADRGYVERAA